MKKFGDEAVVKKLYPVISKTKIRVRFVFLLAALMLLILAIVNPGIGKASHEEKKSGINLMVALDVSNSMNCRDLKPTRLERALRFIFQLADKRPDDRIGLVVFAGSAYNIVPITPDHGALKLVLNSVNTGMISQPGTAIGSALQTSAAGMDGAEKKFKSIILISDGENHEDDAAGAAADARKQGIMIHVIGIGSTEGAPIPLNPQNMNSDFIRDGEGNTVVTHLNETLLRSIAEAGGGKYFHAGNSNASLDQLTDVLGKMETKKFSTELNTDYESRFQLFLVACLLFLLTEMFISETKSGRNASFFRWIDRKTKKAEL